MAGTVRSSLIFFVRVTVTAAIFWMLFRYYGVWQIVEHIDRLDLGWLMAGLVAAIVQIFVLAWRWQLFCRALTGAAPQFSAVLSSLGRSMLIGQLLPTIVGTDVFRATALARAASAAGAVRSVVCDRLLALLALGLMVGAELPFIAWKTQHAASTGSLAVGVFALVGGFILISGFRRWLTRLPIVGKPVAVIVGDLLQALIHWHGRLGFTLGFAAHALAAIVFVALVRSVEPNASLQVAALVILPALLVIAVPISLGGWGVREAAIASGFALLGADSAPAVTASILFGLSGPIGGAVVELLGLFSQANPHVRSGSNRGP